VSISLAFIVFGLIQPRLAVATIFTVNDVNDVADMTPGDGICRTAAGRCSLRAAIQEANSFRGFDTILMPAGVYQLSILGSDEDAAATGDLDIRESVTIAGASMWGTIIDGGGIDRVFDIIPTHLGGNTANGVTMAQLTVRNGSARVGGGIRYASPLTIQNATISDNKATLTGGGIGSAAGVSRLIIIDSIIVRNWAYEGAGIDAAASEGYEQSLKIEGSFIAYNSAFGGGAGGIHAITAELIAVTLRSNFAEYGAGIHGERITIDGSIISGNIATGYVGTKGYGGGIVMSGNSVVSRTIVSGNNADFGGGIAVRRGQARLMNLTIVNNTADSDGGGLYRDGESEAIVVNTIIEANSPRNCGGLPISGASRNNSDSDGTCHP
jgi:CSLREA domain-containing protein